MIVSAQNFRKLCRQATTGIDDLITALNAQPVPSPIGGNPFDLTWFYQNQRVVATTTVSYPGTVSSEKCN